ncbi:hypothetical protein G0U57_017743, partial [Chelydra serpentina]
VFFLVLQSSPGFTHRISNYDECERAGGYCNFQCSLIFAPAIGKCNVLMFCCKMRW